MYGTSQLHPILNNSNNDEQSTTTANTMTCLSLVEQQQQDPCSSDEESSTFVVSPKNPRAPSRKRVRFDPQPATEYDATMSDDDDNDDCVKSARWYSAGELKAFKAGVVQLSKAIIKQDRTTLTDPNGYQRVVRRVWAASLQVQQDSSSSSSPDLARFNRCVRLSPTRLGLERLTVKGMRADIAQRRTELYAHVRTIQAMETTTSSSSNANNKQQKELALAYFSDQISQSSQRFAHQLACALCSDLTESRNG